MTGYNKNVYISQQAPEAQELRVHDNSGDMAELASANIEQQMKQARKECRQLHNQITLVKSKIQDATLQEMARSVRRISKVNLKPTITLKGHSNKITDFRWSSDSRTVLSVSQDGFMLLWDAETGLKRNAITLNSQWVLTCALCPNGNLVASAGLDNNCTVYRVSQHDRMMQNIVSIFKGHTCYISDIEFLDNRSIVSASGDMTCALWDIAKSKRIGEFSDHLGDVLSISVPFDASDGANNVFASGGSDGYLYIWDKRAPRSSQGFSVSESDISKVKFFRNGETIATGSDDGKIRLYDLRSDCKIAQYSLTDGLQNCNEIQQTYRSSAEDHFIGYGIPYYSLAHKMDSGYIDEQGVISLDFSRSGRLMYASYTDYGCVVWDLVRGEIVCKLDGHSNRISGVKTSPDGLAVCTGSWDMAMKIWSPSYM